MRKFILSMSVLLAAVTASAQEFSYTPNFYTGTNLMRFSLLDYFGFGFTVPTGGYMNTISANFLSNTNFGRNREIYFNTMYVEYLPVPFLGVGMGLDCHWSSFRMNKTHYWLPKDYGECATVAVISDDFSKVNRSVLRVFSIDMPIDINVHYGPLAVNMGVSMEINFPGYTSFKGVDTNGNKVKNGNLRSTSIETEPITVNVHGAVSYYGFGMFVKYRPVPQFDEDGGPVMETISFGILLN